MISDKALKEFEEIWKQEFNMDLPDDSTAIKEAVALLTFFDIVYRPIKKEWLEELNKNSRVKK